MLYVASIGRRYVSYVLDLVVLACMTTIVLIPFGVSPVFFVSGFLYFQGMEALRLMSTRDILYTLISFIILGTGYFFFEPYTKTSVGKFITGQKIAVRKGSSSHQRNLMKSIKRALIKAILPVNLIDCLFIFKYRRFNQRYTDAHSGLVVLEEKRSPPKEQRLMFAVLDYLFMSAIIYYLPLLTMIIRSYSFSASLGAGESVSPNTFISVEDALNRILTNNLSLNLEFVIGGIVLLSLTILIVFSSSLVEGIIIGGILRNQPSSISYAVLPHFFFETWGYVVGIAGGIVVSIMILEVVDSYVKGKPFGADTSGIFTNLKCLLIFVMVSMLLIFVGAMIESAMFR